MSQSVKYMIQSVRLMFEGYREQMPTLISPVVDANGQLSNPDNDFVAGCTTQADAHQHVSRTDKLVG